MNTTPGHILREAATDDFTYNACEGIGRVERALPDGALVQRYDRHQDD